MLLGLSGDSAGIVVGGLVTAAGGLLDLRAAGGGLPDLRVSERIGA